MNNELVGSEGAEETQERTLVEIDHYFLVVMGLPPYSLSTLMITATLPMPPEYSGCFRDEMISRISAGAPNYITAVTTHMKERLGDLIEVASAGTFYLSESSGLDVSDALIEEAEKNPDKYPQIVKYIQYVTRVLKSRATELGELEADQDPDVKHEDI